MPAAVALLGAVLPGAVVAVRLGPGRAAWGEVEPPGAAVTALLGVLDGEVAVVAVALAAAEAVARGEASPALSWDFDEQPLSSSTTARGARAATRRMTPILPERLDSPPRVALDR